MRVAPLKQWGALLPLAMSLAGLALVLGHVAVSGAGPEADEGTAVRLWWLLIGAMAVLVLALQAAAMLANLALVRSFNL